MVWIDQSSVTPFTLPWMNVQDHMRSQAQQGCWGRQDGAVELCTQMPSVKQLLASMCCDSNFLSPAPSTNHTIDFSRLVKVYITRRYPKFYYSETEFCIYSGNFYTDSESLSSVELLSFPDHSPPPASNYMRILVDTKFIQPPEVLLKSKTGPPRKRRRPSESLALGTVCVYSESFCVYTLNLSFIHI
jgi:hypothetical protein